MPYNDGADCGSRSVDPKVADFVRLLRAAGVAEILGSTSGLADEGDDGSSPVMDEWSVMDPTGDPAHVVVRFVWDDGRYESVLDLTEGGIAQGQWDGKTFKCADDCGQAVSLQLFESHENMRCLTLDDLHPISHPGSPSMSSTASAEAPVGGVGRGDGKLRTAARALLDAYGGNVPDWLRAECAALEMALGDSDEPADPGRREQPGDHDAHSVHRAQAGHGEPWERDDIQFPRLIAEIVATQELDLPALAESMDLSVDDVNALFDRADQRWEAIKAEIAPVDLPAPRG
ncbi:MULTISPECIES: hypothetical protein [unclassified Burkholderia]|uniref:hypothetical protein n=1 Tax=unclassified Burkholderia TaxID=2613784 RepID=UPI002AAFCA67|nr:MULTISPECIES: hypothetical protein [unclassified Burkholderia]